MLHVVIIIQILHMSSLSGINIRFGIRRFLWQLVCCVPLRSFSFILWYCFLSVKERYWYCYFSYMYGSGNVTKCLAGLLVDWSVFCFLSFSFLPSFLFLSFFLETGSQVTLADLKHVMLPRMALHACPLPLPPESLGCRHVTTHLA